MRLRPVSRLVNVAWLVDSQKGENRPWRYGAPTLSSASPTAVAWQPNGPAEGYQSSSAKPAQGFRSSTPKPMERLPFIRSETLKATTNR